MQSKSNLRSLLLGNFKSILPKVNIALVTILIFHGFSMCNGQKFGLKLGFLSILLSFFSLILVFQAWRSLFRFHRYADIFSQIFFIFFNIFLVSYSLRVRIPFEYSILAINGREGWSWDSLVVEIDSIDAPVFLGASVLSIVFIVGVLLKERSIARLQNNDARITSICWVITAAIYIVSPLPDSNLPINFLRSIYKYYTTSELYPIVPKNTYPLMSLWVDPTPPLSPNKPNIIVILIESLNAEIINTTTKDGRAITPFLNQLHHQGWYFSKFYGNSVQTAKGQFSVLCSTIPATQSKEFTRYQSRNYLSIATLAKQNGYDTYWLQGHDNLNFDETHSFAIKHGFDSHESVPLETVSPILIPLRKVFLLNGIPFKNSATMGAWGPRDIILYRYFFDRIKTNKTKENPKFIVLSTIYSHVPFFIQKNNRPLFSDPKTRFESYANAIHYSDADLSWFLKELYQNPNWKNTVVIITGDHSYPIGTNKNIHPQSGNSEDSFRTPCWIIWPEVLTPRVITTARSQLDIAPTILDILDTPPIKTPFAGQSLLKDVEVPIYLVQPYMGGRISAVRQDWKLVFNLQERLYTAYKLPDESQDQRHELMNENPELYTHLKKDISHILFNQSLIHQNQIFPVLPPVLHDPPK